MKQLSIFDFIDNEKSRIKISSQVKVLPAKENAGPEDYYYIKEFENEIGCVRSIIHGTKSVTFEVHFKNNIGFFYESDLKEVK